jgi:endonuclease V-like protein UPF0215 family
MAKRICHVTGCDDVPFEHAHRGGIMIVGMEAVQGVYVQHTGITLDKAADLFRRLATHSALPGAPPHHPPHRLRCGLRRKPASDVTDRLIPKERRWSD